MNQTLHIFSKDTRRFWPEILISICLLAAFAYVLPVATADQLGRFDRSFVIYSLLETVFYVLMPISWWVLTSRVIHEENLVGDRQFWITRPYQWPSLMAAKLLFLVAYILVPIGLAQAVILSLTGFHVAALVPGVLFGVFILGVLVILPLAALSAITPSFAKLTVTMLGIVLGVLVFGSLIVPRASRNFGVTPHASRPYILITFAACAAIVLLQYARRRTLIARVVLGSAIVLLVLWPIFFSTSLMSLYFHANAAPGAADPISVDKGAKDAIVSLDASRQPFLSGTSIGMSSENQIISLPVAISGGAPDAMVAIEAIRVTLSTGSGLKYTGPWQSLGQSVYRPGEHENLQVSVPNAFLDRAKSLPVAMRITLGTSQFRPEGTTTVPFPSSRTEIPGIGICSGTRNPLNHGSSSYNLTCTSPLRNSGFTFVTARWSDSPCEQPQPPAGQLIAGDTYTGSFDSDPAEYGISPLVKQQIDFSNGNVPLPNNGNRQRYLCAGTPLTFTPYDLTRRSTVELNVPELNLLASPPSGPVPPGSLQLENPFPGSSE